jgi:dihydrodipicolinate synthase/N-acetylneuraminate lyase
MRSIEQMRPCPGLSVPVVTVLDEAGALVEPDQRALVRFVLQEGYGADIVFAAGTTGEWHRVDNRTRQAVVQICTEEVAKQNSALGDGRGRPVECWAGVTAPTPEETLENLDFAIACGADAAVLAPLSISGIDDPVRFVQREVSDLLDTRTRRIPVYLYDNPDIAVNPRIPHIRTRQVKAMSRLDFVRGIKVSAPRRVMGNYRKAAASFLDRGEFGIYVGNAMLIFPLFRPRPGWLGVIAEHWNRFRLSGGIPIGVVSGPANVLPREWARAWQVSRAGDVERIDAAETVHLAFRAAMREAGAKLTIACLKSALRELGVIESDAVAAGTPALEPESERRFLERFAAVRAMARERIGAPFVSALPQDVVPRSSA